MAKYEKYAEYKDSGVEWLKDIPKNWFIGDFRRGIDFLTDFEANGSFADVKANVDLDSEEKFAWYVRATDLQNQRFGIVDGNRTVDSKAYSFLNKTALFGGELLVAKRGEIGKVYLMPEMSSKATLAPNLYLIRLNNLLYPKYTFYWFLSLYGKPQLELADKSTTIGALYKDDVKACQMLYPSYKEQKGIANFLDHETAQIDSLIAKQEKLIELLKEKRQAVISHAVTKGLNPDVAMKDSGVEWLGQVPEHWVVLRLKNLISSLESGCSVNAADIPAQSHELGVLKTSCVYTRSFRIEENKTVVPEDIHRVKCKVRKGAIIISRMNTPELVGASALVKTEAENIYLPDRLWQTIFFENIEIDAEYLSHFMTVQGFRDQIALGAEGASSSMQNIAKEDYLNINCLVPPLKEQTEIRDYIEQKLAILGKLNMKAQEAVERLKERRTALISSAVTGKIDVRNWQNPNKNNEAKTELGA